MTSSSPTSGHNDEPEHVDSGQQQQQQQQKEKRLSFGISQILQSDDHRRRPGRDRDVTSGDGGATASTMALIRSAFGSYATDPGSVPGLLIGGSAGLAGAGLYGAGSGVIRVPAQRLSAAVCVGQQAPAATAAAACRLSAMMFPWMRERKDGLTCTYLASAVYISEGKTDSVTPRCRSATPYTVRSWGSVGLNPVYTIQPVVKPVVQPD